MNKFQIVEVTEQLNHAGTKATSDMSIVAEKLGFKPVKVKMDSTKKTFFGKVIRQIGYFRDWRKAEKEVTEGSILLLQHPFHYPQLTREKTLRNIKNKNVKIISLVHDVEELRVFRYNDYYKREFEFMLEIADIIIVHNEVMKKWFIERGVEEKKLVTLGIFDYLQNVDKYEDDNKDKDIVGQRVGLEKSIHYKKPNCDEKSICDEKSASVKKTIIFEKSITVAGNLDTEKCGYIKELADLKGIKVHLYGPNFNEALKDSGDITYHGSFPSSEIPKKLDRGFGLVWDGESINGCKGASGQYLRYNNPHKLSLYLSSGLPVIIWKEAAEAGFVEENKVGITVQNVKELEGIFDTLTAVEYETMTGNVRRISEALCKGKYGEEVLRKSMTRLL